MLSTEYECWDHKIGLSVLLLSCVNLTRCTLKKHIYLHTYL